MIKDSAPSQSFLGIYRGVVKDNADPLKVGRLKVQIPQILATSVTEWIWPKDTANIRSAPPANGQGVWVMFEGGDPHYPVWVGTFGNHVDDDKHINTTPLANSVSLSAVSGLLITQAGPDGKMDIMLASTLVALAQQVSANKSAIASHTVTIANHEGRITALEGAVSSLSSTTSTQIAALQAAIANTPNPFLFLG